jgi:peptidoglycan/LPS O-acetylase OafA/YrhL
MLHFKTRIHTPHTMVLFGVLAYLWIRKELAYSKRKAPWSWLVSAGAWSYSLYLIHPAATTVLANLRLPSFGYLVDWFASYTFILGMCYLFYLTVERPSHAMARRIRVIARREAPAHMGAEAGGTGTLRDLQLMGGHIIAPNTVRRGQPK